MGRAGQVRIYVMTHKAFDAPPDDIYVPVHVGRAAWRKARGESMWEDGGRGSEARERAGGDEERKDTALAGYTGDDSGDNISDQNCYFSELTGLYWVWKNVRDVEYVGTCHYRRYLLKHARKEAGAFAHGGVFTAQEIISVLAQYDVITTKNLQLNYSYYEGFASHHKILYLDETAQVIADRHPEYSADFMRLVHEKHTYFGNMLICKKARYDSYCAWLFDILFELQRRVPVVENDSYHRRIFGFLSEFLQYVWIVHNRLSVYECMVGMLGEKAEVTEVKRELAAYFKEADYEGAKDCFLQARARRPDLLMEASDITGELHLAMEVIAIAGLEQQAYGTNLLFRMRDFGELMAYCNRLNRYAAQLLRKEAEPELLAWAESGAVTEVAVNTACAVMRAASGDCRFPIAALSGKETSCPKAME